MVPGKRLSLLLICALLSCGGVAACASSPADTAPAGRIRVVAAENQYGDVARQIGGAYVAVYSVVSNPGTDPHTYEVSPRVAAAVGSAAVVIQNGAGYDSFMQKVESASSGRRRVLDVQKLLRLPNDTPNPHLWYDPATMPAVASALAGVLGEIQPGHAAYFTANAGRFDSALQSWTAALGEFRRAHPGVLVAATEPVAGYMLRAAGADDRTPFSFETDIMNGTDPAPQDLTFMSDLLRHRRVKALLYNRQVTDTITAGFVREAQRAGVPVVAVYETMPVPGYDYQSWMLAELHALDRAVASGVSTRSL